MVAVLIFLLGLVVGSFLNAFLYRMEKGESVAKGRSYCPACSHGLAWNDLIPLLSFVALQGKCRYCHAPISWEHPLFEISTGLLFLAIAILTGEIYSFLSLIHLLYLLVVASCLIGIFIYDFKHFLIPDRLLVPAVLASVAWYFIAGLSGFIPLSSLAVNIGAAILAAGAFFSLHFVSQGKWMGFADGKLVFLLGLVLGFPLILVSLLITFVTGSLTGIVLILLQKKTFKSEVPFAPFLILGMFAALFWGNHAVAWYLHLLY
ncbi:MAG: prepilin peptidase [bacterium]|nr:prepilin peptidase [bacterium]